MGRETVCQFSVLYVYSSLFGNIGALLGLCNLLVQFAADTGILRAACQTEQERGQREKLFLLYLLIFIERIEFCHVMHLAADGIYHRDVLRALEVSCVGGYRCENLVDH